MKTLISPEIERNIQQLYASARCNSDEKIAITLLHIAQDYTVLAYGKGQTTPESMWLLEIGAKLTANNYFRNYPPTAGEVEEAIQLVEDEVMTLSKLLPADSLLYTSDMEIREIALLANRFSNNINSALLSRTDMELIFGRLAAIISGRPISSDNLPATNSFAATLLILREIMFHLKFMEITCL
ncbi:MAG: hypothetical protein PHR83_18155 [Paludibacter sp.]|nr:hypothetical protein [Paludibacter sp.]